MQGSIVQLEWGQMDAEGYDTHILGVTTRLIGSNDSIYCRWTRRGMMRAS